MKPTLKNFPTIGILAALYLFFTFLPAQKALSQIFSFDSINTRSSIIISDSNYIEPVPVIHDFTKNENQLQASLTDLLNPSGAIQLTSVTSGSHIPSSYTVPTSGPVMEIPMRYDVSANGSLSINVPIECVPGRNGFQPDISLSYNNFAGSGELGAGWRIAGISAISRLGSIYYYDGKTKGDNINSATTNFTLDGAKLIYKGSNIYEPEQGFVKIKQVLTGSIVKYFEVSFPNGSVGIYGYESNTTAQLTYPLTKLTDATGKTVNYTYNNTNGQYYINKIEYGNSKGNAENYASILFTYKTRSDISFTYLAGRKLNHTLLLDKIQCKNGSAITRTYTLTYETKNQSLLKQIDCTVGAGKLNPLIFYYGSGTSTASLQNSTLYPTHTFRDTEIDNLIVNIGKIDPWSEDDGLIVYPYRDPYLNYNNRYINQYHPDQEIAIYVGLKDYSSYPTTIKAGEGFIKAFALNADNNAGDEIIQINNRVESQYDVIRFKIYSTYTSLGMSGTQLKNEYVYRFNTALNKSNNWSVSPKEYLTGDFDGDGRPDIFAITRYKPLGVNNSSVCYIFNIHNGTTKFSGQVSGFNYNTKVVNNAYEADIIFGIDYDGDGKTEICHIHENGTDIWGFDNGTFVKCATITDLKLSTLKNKKFLVGDINGDGKTDLLLSPLASYYRYWYEYVSVMAHRYCPYCYGQDPGTSSCKHCRKILPVATNCYHCGMRLQNCGNGGIGGEIPGSGHVIIDQPGIGMLDNKCCTSCGSSSLAYRSEYVDYGNKWTAWYAKGAGDFEKSELTIVNHGKESDGTEYNYVLQDMNGDGKDDLIRHSNGTVYIHKAVNGGISASTETGVYTFVPTKAKIIPSLVSDRQYHTQLLMMTKDQREIRRISFTRDDSRESLLTGAINSFGVTIKATYQRLNGDGYYGYGSYPDFYTKGTGAVFPYQNFNGAISCVSQLQVYHNNKLYDSKTYKYSNALIHAQGLGFRGFTTVTEKDRRGREKTLTFNPLQFGLPVSEVTPVSENGYQYSVSVAADKKATIKLNKTTVRDKLNNNTLTTTYEYDSYLNVTKQTQDYGNNIKTVTDNTYTNQTTPLYIIGQLKQTQATGYKNGLTIIKKEIYEYFDNALLKSAKTYVGNNKDSEIQYTYDASGNVLTEKAYAYNSTDYLQKTYTYDAKQRFMTKEQNAFNQATTYSGHNIYGSPATITDYKGKIKTCSYDDFGRTTKIVTPDGITSQTAYYWSISTLSQIYRVVNSATETPPETVYYDAFNRDIKSSVFSFSGQDRSVNKEYDDYGRVSRVSEEYLGGSPTRWAVNAYDNYDRITQITLPTGKLVKYTYGVNTVKTEDGNLVKTETMDASGALIKVNDAAGDVVYTLRPDGQPTKVVSPGNVTTTFEYDAYGRKTKITDPSFGVIQYAYDAYGNMNKVTDANNKVSQSTYDKYGRILSHTVKNGAVTELSTTYAYNSDQLLQTVTGGGKTTAYTYDDLRRTLTETETADGISLKTTYSYSVGKIKTVTYSGFAGTQPPMLEYVYNGAGYVTQLKAGTSTIKVINAKNHFGKTTQYTLANGVVVNHTYDPNGYPTAIKAVKGNTALQHFSYSFNASNSTLTSRKDEVRGITESFTYDNLKRLTKAGNIVTAFDVKGNITSKTDAGGFVYNVTNKPFAIGELTANNGSIPPRTQDIAYNGMHRPVKITENNVEAALTYGHDYKRYKMAVKQNNALQYTRYYLGEVYEKDVSATGSTTERLYFGGTPYNADVVYTRTGTGAWVINYIHRDHLGSITLITNSAGTIAATYSYDAWGRLRNPVNQTPFLPGQEPELLLKRGYTGHEYLPTFGLINMNARLYDPVLGRFLSPDPYVQEPDNSQNYNSYSYVLNNPLMYTDESGEWFFIDDLIAGVIGGVVNVVSGLISGEIRDIGDGLAYFGIGAAAGVGSLYGGPLVGAAVLGFGNNAWNQFDRNGYSFNNFSWGEATFSTFMSVGTAYLGGQLGRQVGTQMGKLTGGIKSPTLRMGLEQSLTNGITGFTLGGAVALSNEETRDGWFSAASKAGLFGFGMGLTTGVASGIRYAREHNINPLTGAERIEQRFSAELGSVGAKGLKIDAKLVKGNYLEDNGIDPHSFKKVWGNSNGSNSHFNIYKVTKTGQLILVSKDYKIIIHTTEYIK